MSASDEPKPNESDAQDVPDAPEEAHASFGVDPTLAAAMAEAEASYSQRKAEASGEDFPIESEPGEGEEVVLDTPPSRAPPMPTGAGEGVVRALAQLRETLEKLEKVEAAKAEAEAALLRARADLENYKKRAAREVEQERKFANEALLKELLPVVDNLERALAATEGATLEQYASGVEMVQKSFIAALERFGVEQFTTEGELFDPERMEAMQQLEVADRAPGTVIQEFMKGYRLKGRLVRPAMVIVAKAPESASPDVSEERSVEVPSENTEAVEASPTSTTPHEDASGSSSAGGEDGPDAGTKGDQA